MSLLPEQIDECQRTTEELKHDAEHAIKNPKDGYSMRVHQRILDFFETPEYKRFVSLQLTVKSMQADAYYDSSYDRPCDYPCSHCGEVDGCPAMGGQNRSAINSFKRSSPKAEFERLKTPAISEMKFLHDKLISKFKKAGVKIPVFVEDDSEETEDDSGKAASAEL
jgi:hypothetical protein